MPFETTLQRRNIFSSRKTVTIRYKIAGVIEACYDFDLARELMAIATKWFWDENVGFVVSVNHLLCRKVQIGTKLWRLVGIQTGNMDHQMHQVYQRFVPTASAKPVNLSSDIRSFLMNNWTSIRSAQAVSQMLEARELIASTMVRDCLPRDLATAVISRRLYKTLQLSQSPTDAKVMKKIGKMGPEYFIQHLGGRKLSYDEMRAQFAALYE